MGKCCKHIPALAGPCSKNEIFINVSSLARCEGWFVCLYTAHLPLLSCYLNRSLLSNEINWIVGVLHISILPVVDFARNRSVKENPCISAALMTSTSSRLETSSFPNSCSYSNSKYTTNLEGAKQLLAMPNVIKCAMTS